MSVTHNKPKELSERLLKKGADLNIQDNVRIILVLIILFNVQDNNIIYDIM